MKNNPKINNPESDIFLSLNSHHHRDHLQSAVPKLYLLQFRSQLIIPGINYQIISIFISISPFLYILFQLKVI